MLTITDPGYYKMKCFTNALNHFIEKRGYTLNKEIKEIQNNYIETLLAAGFVITGSIENKIRSIITNHAKKYYSNTGKIMADVKLNQSINNIIESNTRDLSRRLRTNIDTVQQLANKLPGNNVDTFFTKTGKLRPDYYERMLAEGKKHGLDASDLKYYNNNNFAMSINRTLYNDAKFNRALLAGQATHKQWITSSSPKTRHSIMDGVVVEIDEMFEVVNDINGNTSMGRFPTDPILDDSNSINCLCNIRYINKN